MSEFYVECSSGSVAYGQLKPSKDTCKHHTKGPNIVNVNSKVAVDKSQIKEAPEVVREHKSKQVSRGVETLFV